jgi:hypothetical protein
VPGVATELDCESFCCTAANAEGELEVLLVDSGVFCANCAPAPEKRVPARIPATDIARLLYETVIDESGQAAWPELPGPVLCSCRHNYLQFVCPMEQFLAIR